MSQSTAANAAPALGFSIVANLPGERQMTVQSFIPLDASAEDTNAILDKVMEAVNRQVAKGRLPEALKDLAQVQTSLGNYLDDRDRVEANYEAEKVRLLSEIDKLNATAEEAYKNGYSAWASSGRSGEYRPANSVKNLMDRAAQEAEKVKEHLAKQEAERAQAIANLGTSEQRFKEKEASLKAEIEELKAQIGG